MTHRHHVPASAPSATLLTIDTSTALWLDRAIRREKKWSADNSAQVPASVGPLHRTVQKAATSGQERTVLGILAEPTHTENRDQAIAVTYTEAARRLDISARTLRRWIREGHLTPTIVGSTKRIAVVELERITAEQE